MRSCAQGAHDPETASQITREVRGSHRNALRANRRARTKTRGLRKPELVARPRTVRSTLRSGVPTRGWTFISPVRPRAHPGCVNDRRVQPEKYESNLMINSSVQGSENPDLGQKAQVSSKIQRMRGSPPGVREPHNADAVLPREASNGAPFSNRSTSTASALTRCAHITPSRVLRSATRGRMSNFVHDSTPNRHVKQATTFAFFSAVSAMAARARDTRATLSRRDRRIRALCAASIASSDTHRPARGGTRAPACTPSHHLAFDFGNIFFRDSN